MPRLFIAEFRKKRNLSQAQIARALGLAGSRYSRLELGYSDPTPHEISAICAYLGVSVHELEAGEAAVPIEVKPAHQSGRASGTAEEPLPPQEQHGVRKVANFQSSPDLTDPKRFDEWPDISILKSGANNSAFQRSRLESAMRYAETILHTSRVPAQVWVRWRDFFREAQTELRHLG